MKRKELIKHIKTKYILMNIFQYIKVEDFKLKLFFYSKHYQKELEIELDEYQEIFLRKKNLNLCNYLNLEKIQNMIKV